MRLNRLLRLGRWAYQRRLRFLYRLLRFVMRCVFCCDIPFSDGIDSTVHFNHNGFGIVINPLCKIGGGEQMFSIL